MGSQTHASGRDHGSARRGRFVLVLLLTALAALIAAQTAAATFHLMKIREVRPAGAGGSYVELQMWSGGQNAVSGHDIRAYTATGTLDHEFVMNAGVASGTNQKTVLIAGPGYSGPAADFTDPNLNLPAAGGAVCFTDGEPPDCVAWGNFTGGGSLPSTPGSPASPGGVTAGKALLRSIAPGCATLLEPGDDTNNSATDFSEQDPNPRPNAAAVVEAECNVPSTSIGTKPPLKTQSQTAEFSFSASPPAGATFECKLDSEAFAGCTSPKKYEAPPLAGGSHTFQVRAKNASGTGSAASYTWEVDLIPPTTTISNPKPPTPNSGASLTFKFSSSESGSSFACSLAKVGDPDAFSGCSVSGKTYSGLTDGSYVFKVRSTDTAGNEGLPAEYPFTVDTSLKDTTPPETTITGKPTDPSSSSTAAFTYESTEAGSTFQCKMDAEAFSACPAEGKTYTGLAEGPHTFQVRATDSSANTDASPAGASFSIVLPVTPPEVIPPPTPPAGDAPVAPDTKLTGKPKAKSTDKTPTFKFTSTVSPASFECQLDGRAFRACRSPLTTKALKPGRHSFKVRAVGPTGLEDSSPAASSFKVVKPKR